MKVSELTGAALDWAVHIALHGACEGYAEHEYSTDWAQGGPIIDRMKLNRLTTNALGGYTASVKLTRINTDDDAYMVWTHGSGPTPLVAAMRCYVASKLGDDIDLPKELT
jgi:hypothetical protein